MKIKIIIIAGILIITLGASWYIFVQIQKQIEEEFIASIPNDMKVVYGNFNVDPIAQKITIEQTNISHKNMFNGIKGEVDVGGVSNEDEFEENFDKIFSTKGQEHHANTKLQQLAWVYKLLNNFSSAKHRDKYITDIVL